MERISAIEAVASKQSKPRRPIEWLLELETAVAGSSGSPVADKGLKERADWLDGQLSIESLGKLPERLGIIQAEMTDQGFL